MRYFALSLLLFCGSFELYAQEFSENVKYVLQALHVKADQCALDFIAEKPLPGSQDEWILLIPEYLDKDEESGHYDLRAHVVVYNSRTKTMRHTILESSEWYSDAMVLNEVKIDTAPYLVGKGKRAFGIRVRHNGASRANPYGTETLTLIVPEKETLDIVLLEFETRTYAGELSGNCASKESLEESILIMTEDGSKPYFDIRVKTTVDHMISFIDPTGECDQESCTFTYERVLQYGDGGYFFKW